MKIIVFAEKPKCRGRQALFVCSYYKIPITYHLFDFLLTGKRYYYTLANESVDIYFLPSPWKIPQRCAISAKMILCNLICQYITLNNKIFSCILTMNSLNSNSMQWVTPAGKFHQITAAVTFSTFLETISTCLTFSKDFKAFFNKDHFIRSVPQHSTYFDNVRLMHFQIRIIVNIKFCFVFDSCVQQSEHDY